MKKNKIISIANIKGGSTKSTTAIHLCDALSREARTLAVDMDCQADLSDFFLPDLSIEELENGNTFTLLTGETTLKESIHKTSVCDLIPGILDLAELTTRASSNPAIFTRLKNALNDSEYSYTVIDTPGSLGTEVAISLIASDIVLIPVTPSKWALRAVRMIQNEIKNTSEVSGKKPKAFIIPAMFGKSKRDEELLEMLRQVKDFKMLKDIPKSASIQSRTENREKLKTDSEAYEAFTILANEIINL